MSEVVHDHLIDLRKRVAAGIEHLREYGIFDAESGKDVRDGSIARDTQILEDIEAVMIKHGIDPRA